MLLILALVYINVVGFRINSINSPLIKTQSDTIYGLCSSIPPGGCAIAIVRVSGPKAGDVFNKITGDSFNKYKSKTSLFKRLYTIDNEPIDDAICILFPSPKSYTGEDVVEFHIHGSVAILNELFDSISRVDTYSNIRLADRGEFTRRAFNNKKLKLSQVEAIGDLIASSTKEQRKLAFSGLSGSICDLYKEWADKLILALSNLEACIDFGEESSSDIQIFDTIKDTKTTILNLLEDITSKINDKRGIMVKNYAKVIILGPPNSGKSSLINSISQENISIVSNIAGTTRDLVTAHANIDGYPFMFIDTAGIREIENQLSSHNSIEYEGITRALNASLDADMILQLLDPSNEEQSLLALDRTLEMIKDKNTPLILCHSKSDLPNKDFNSAKMKCPSSKFIKISPLKNSNIAQLGKLIKELLQLNNTDSCITNQRHIEHLNAIKYTLEQFLDVDLKDNIEIGAEYLRTSLINMDAITGINVQESVLNKIFSNFCIGK